MFIGFEASCIRFRRRSCAGDSRSRRNGSVHWYGKAKVNGRRTRYAPIKLATLATEPTGGGPDLLSRANLRIQIGRSFSFFFSGFRIVYVLSDNDLLTTSQDGEMIE